jgi:hypothetical protein
VFVVKVDGENDPADLTYLLWYASEEMLKRSMDHTAQLTFWLFRNFFRNSIEAVGKPVSTEG